MLDRWPAGSEVANVCGLVAGSCMDLFLNKGVPNVSGSCS